MALRILLEANDTALRKKSREVTAFDQRLHQLLDDMHETMANAEGVGIAAVQIGILRRVVVIDIEGRLELINPVLTQASEETLVVSEGCLSFLGERGMVPRPQKVTVNAFDRHGKPFTFTGEDMLARAICHELDHLEGVTFHDRAIMMQEPD